MPDINYLTVNHISRKHLARIFSRVDFCGELFNGTPCWVWIGIPHVSGYAHIRWQCSKVGLHRVVYAWLIKPIPKGSKFGELDHLCRNKLCCNPLHLEFVPTRTNILRGKAPAAVNARKTHCKYGHPFSGENLILVPATSSRRARRDCRICRSENGQKFRSRHAADIKQLYRKYYERWRDKKLATHSNR